MVHEENLSHDILTIIHRSKDDCSDLEELVSVDGSVLERISKIMSYLRLGTSGKVLKKKKKDKNIYALSNDYDKDEKPPLPERGMPNHRNEIEIFPPPPPLPRNFAVQIEKAVPIVARDGEEDIFVGEGVDYAVPTNDMSPAASKDMEYNFSFIFLVSQNGYDDVHAHALAAGGYQGEWQNYHILQDPPFMTQEEKDRGLGSLFKHDDQRLQQLKEKDAREKDPNFISDISYNREFVGSDDEDDLSKMDMGGRGRFHRWDFETEEEWATYNEQKEAMPKASFRFGVKMDDGRKTRKQNKDQKLTNELHKINKILLRKKMDKEGGGDDGGDYDDEPLGKKIRS
ncbi:hypothetical protein MKX03_004971 [Papaver bracteatum]|nr:hypothetical protein MKX03_004971 [Papaver bracteatum]